MTVSATALRTILAVAALASTLVAQTPIFQGSFPVSQGAVIEAGPAAFPVDDVNFDGRLDFAMISGAQTWEIRSGVDASLISVLNLTSTSLTFIKSSLVSMGDIAGNSEIDFAVQDWMEISLRSSVSGVVHWTQPLQTGIQRPILRKINDVDGDGIADIFSAPQRPHVVNSAQYFPGALTNLPSPLEFRSGATGALLNTINLNGAVYQGAIPVGDLDFDGDDEIAVLSWDVVMGVNQLRIYDSSTAGFLFTLPTPMLTQSFHGAFLEGGHDVDGDGTNDIIIGNAAGDVFGPRTGEINVISGSNGAPIVAVTGETLTSLGQACALGDFNGDGRADFAGLKYQQGGPTTRGIVFSGVSGIELDDTVADLALCTSLAFADFDGDGFEDLLAAGYTNLSQTLNVVAIPGGPTLGNAGNGTTSVQANLLSVNGSTGGRRRAVEIPLGASLSFELLAPPANPTGADFALFGAVGVPPEDQPFSLGLGASPMAITPAPFTTSPDFFTLASSLGGIGPVVFPAAPLPWFLSLPNGLATPVTFTLQGLVFDSPSQIRQTNGIVVRVR